MARMMTSEEMIIENLMNIISLMDENEIIVNHCNEIFKILRLKNKFEYTDFHDDEEKMVDFWELTKEEFLDSYSYLTEEEYDLTVEYFKKKLEEK